MKEYLQHYGIKGQKWGLRRFQKEDGSLTAEGRSRYGVNSNLNRKKLSAYSNEISVRGTTSNSEKMRSIYDREDGTKDLNRLQKDAKKDAEDMARAKAYYGEGAGNRRKQIRNRISERMKDSDYKAEYEKHFSNQNMSEHQRAANRERKVQNTKNTIAKVGRGVKNLIMGAGTTSVAAISIYNLAKMTGADRVIANAASQALNKLRR